MYSIHQNDQNNKKIFMKSSYMYILTKYDKLCTNYVQVNNNIILYHVKVLHSVINNFGNIFSASKLLIALTVGYRNLNNICQLDN